MAKIDKREYKNLFILGTLLIEPFRFIISVFVKKARKATIIELEIKIY